LRKTTAGVATVVSPKINNTYNINQLPLPPSLQGYALLLELAPKSGDAPLYLLNVYFDSASSAARTKQVLDLTRTLPESPRIVLGGDFNFVEDKYRDSSSQSSHYDSSELFARAWSAFKAKFQLKEVKQSTHTFISGCTLDTTISSRLDRFYISYSEEDWATSRPYTYISTVPLTRLHSISDYDQIDSNNTASDHDPSHNSILPNSHCNQTGEHSDPTRLSAGGNSREGEMCPSGSRRFTSLDPSQCEGDHTQVAPQPCSSNTPPAPIRTPSNSRSPSSFVPSDHFPLSLAFKPDVEPLHNAEPRIPNWVPEDPRFAQIFGQRWRDIAHKLDQDDAYGAHAAFKACMYDAAQEVIVAARAEKQRYRDEVHRLTVLLRLHREMDRAARTLSTTRLSRFLTAHPTLPTSQQSVRDAIRSLLKASSIEQQASKPGAASIRKSSSAVGKIKMHLPSTRVRLRALRKNLATLPTTDPDLMAALAAAYWSKIWAARAPEECISPDAYFQFFQKSLPEDQAPTLPTEQEISDCIAGSNNSCAGPDGIPFSAWRALRELAAPVLHMVIVALSSGVPPPADFNNGLLFLLPKTGTLLPSDTRPISVTNADNRIIAQAVVEAITPYLYDTLDLAQKGFITGRSFEDHIRAINEAFYSVVEDQDATQESNLHILFMDTAKAFDSIDHDFIMAALKRAGLPGWLLRLVRGLLHQVKVRPAFKGASAHWISIMRGVKQGCPLSPLLFVICYDILLCRISLVDGATPYACADDLAVTASSPAPLFRVMALVDDFRKASGLGVNTNKTKILSAKHEDLSAAISTCPWPDVGVATEYTYLGVLIGPEVTVLDVFAKALTGLVDRAAHFAPVLKHLSHMHRVITFNVFIITKISYLVKFYPLPYTHKAKGCPQTTIERVARRLVIRSHTAYPYFHLISPNTAASPGTPLRDAWALSLSTLAAQADLTAWEGATKVTIPSSDSMLISHSIQAAGAEFVTYALGELPADEEFKAADHTFASSNKQRSHMYDLLVYAGYRDNVDCDIEDKLRARGLTHCEELVDTVHHNYSLMPTSLPPHFRSTQFDLVMNSLMTERRSRHWGGSTLGPVFTAEDTPACYICGKGQDSAQHLYGGECEPVTLARQAFARTAACRVAALKGVPAAWPSPPPLPPPQPQHPAPPQEGKGKGKTAKPDLLKVPPLTPDTLHAADFFSASLLAFPTPGATLDPDVRARAVAAMSVFNGVVWFERAYYFRMRSSPPAIAEATNWLADIAALELTRAYGTRTAKGLGKAGSRTQAQRVAARAYGAELLAGVQPNSLIAFTDGAAKGNPGPCGAGAYIYDNTSPYWDREASAALGQGTNNLGELWGLGMALQMARARITTHPHKYKRIYIFTDSQFALGIVTGGWRSRTHATLAKKLKLMVRSLPIPVVISWVPAHCGIDSNERADELADRGALKSSRHGQDVNATTDFTTDDFVPRHYDG
jgi:ribonuclease HI